MENEQMTPEEIRENQIEALGSLTEYSPKLLESMRTSVKELQGEKLEDTYEYLRMVLDGVNWELQVLNGCLSLINEKETVIEKESVNPFIERLSSAFMEKEDDTIVEILVGEMIPFIEKLTAIAQSYQN